MGVWRRRSHSKSSANRLYPGRFDLILWTALRFVTTDRLQTHPQNGLLGQTHPAAGEYAGPQAQGDLNPGPTRLRETGMGLVLGGWSAPVLRHEAARQRRWPTSFATRPSAAPDHERSRREPDATIDASESVRVR